MYARLIKMCQTVLRVTRIWKYILKVCSVSSFQQLQVKGFINIVSNEVNLLFCFQAEAVTFNCFCEFSDIFIKNTMGFGFAFVFSSCHFYLHGVQEKGRGGNTSWNSMRISGWTWIFAIIHNPMQTFPSFTEAGIFQNWHTVFNV